MAASVVISRPATEADMVLMAKVGEEAEGLADHVLSDILAGFGDHQDAMVLGEPWLWHGRLSAALNLGLLDPLDLCRRADQLRARFGVTLGPDEDQAEGRVST